MSRYQYKHEQVIFNDMEARINLLYVLLAKNIMPWMWDHEHYDNEYNSDMIGFFYPEDLYAILQIQYLEGQAK
ncbi:MAG TPA: hypothetical protein VL854_08020 [Nitrososphaeraceae archaeon]|nr:hypothetical protein [Nitrososphaeraceae archaeon]